MSQDRNEIRAAAGKRPTPTPAAKPRAAGPGVKDGVGRETAGRERLGADGVSLLGASFLGGAGGGAGFGAGGVAVAYTTPGITVNGKQRKSPAHA